MRRKLLQHRWHFAKDIANLVRANVYLSRSGGVVGGGATGAAEGREVRFLAYRGMLVGKGDGFGDDVAPGVPLQGLNVVKKPRVNCDASKRPATLRGAVSDKFNGGQSSQCAAYRFEVVAAAATRGDLLRELCESHSVVGDPGPPFAQHRQHRGEHQLRRPPQALGSGVILHSADDALSISEQHPFAMATWAAEAGIRLAADSGTCAGRSLVIAVLVCNTRASSWSCPCLRQQASMRATWHGIPFTLRGPEIEVGPSVSRERESELVLRGSRFF